MPQKGIKYIAVRAESHQKSKLAATSQGVSLMEFTERALEVAMPPAFRKQEKKGETK